jgi:hypothetical protein
MPRRVRSGMPERSHSGAPRIQGRGLEAMTIDTLFVTSQEGKTSSYSSRELASMAKDEARKVKGRPAGHFLQFQEGGAAYLVAQHKNKAGFIGQVRIRL